MSRFSGLDPVNAMLLKDVVKEEIEKAKLFSFVIDEFILRNFVMILLFLITEWLPFLGNLHSIKRNYPQNKLIVRSDDNNKIISEYNAALYNNDSVLITLLISRR